MNISDELVKLQYEHKNAVKRIWLEKALFAAMLGILAFGAQVILSSHESRLTSNRFLLEKRYEALSDLRDGYDQVVASLHKFASIRLFHPDAPSPMVHQSQQEYSKAVDSFLSKANHWSFLFSPDFSEVMVDHARFHLALSSEEVELKVEMYTFCSEVADSFAYDSAKVLIESKSGRSNRTQEALFRFHHWSEKEMAEKGLKGYFDHHYELWSKS